MIEITELLIVAGYGALGGAVIGLTGYLKSSVQDGKDEKNIFDKLTAADFDVKRFATTVGLSAVMGALFAAGLSIGIVPQESLLVAAPYALREFLSDLMKVKSGLGTQETHPPASTPAAPPAAPAQPAQDRPPIK